MDYINNSVRTIGHFFSSPPPANILGKRKVVSDEDTDSSSESEHEYRDDDISDEDDDYHLCTPPPTEKRVQKPQPAASASWSDAITQRAEAAMRKARSAMRKNETIQIVRSDERDIQKALNRQERQEEADGSKPPASAQKTKSPKTATHRTNTTSVPNNHDQVLCNSKQDTTTSPSAETFGHGTPIPARAWNCLTAKEQWSTKPNRRARELLEQHSHDATAILEDLQEPEYVCRDIEIRDGVRKMMGQMETFVKEHFSFDVNDGIRLHYILQGMQKETVKIIGCVASGGPAGAKGWEDLFLATDKRQALVCAVIGNVLVEQVFQHTFFGGTEDHIKEVTAIQYEHRHEDGFDRNTLYAAEIRSFLTPTSKTVKHPLAHHESPLHLPTNFNNHTNHIVAALYTHLKPILLLSPTTNTPSILSALHSLTTLTALLSLQMRLDPHTAYHIPPTFKETPFTRSEMRCINESTMRSTHPRTTDTHSLSLVEQQRMQADEALVHIAVFPGIVAYRRGGWETVGSCAEGRVFERGCEGRGVRARRVTDAWVFCRWGRERVWGEERAGVEAGVHGVGSQGGFVEFEEVWRGVRGGGR